MSHFQLALCLLNFALVPTCPPYSFDAYPTTAVKFNPQLTLQLKIRYLSEEKLML